MWNQSPLGLVVAVIDTGVGTTTELSGRLVPGYDFVDNDSDPSEVSAEPYEQCDSQSCWTVYPAYGHGTFIAHEISGIRAITKVARGLRIMQDHAGAGTRALWNRLNVDCCRSIDWAVANGADIINLSLGSYYPDATTLAAVNNAVANGVVVVAAAGNSGARFDQYLIPSGV